jgi:RNA-directed DNA polymerase
MTETSGSDDIYPRLERVAKLAREAPTMAFTTLNHLIDIDLLREAYRRTRKDGAAGVDGQTAVEYAKNLDANLRALLERAKSGEYRAPPVRRVHIPKGDGSQTRPIGIPTFEDKVLQRAVAMVLEAIYEEDFKDFSYGFRSGRSAHQMLASFWDQTMAMNGGWVVEVDVQQFFDTLDHSCLRQILRRRVRDGVIMKLIGKWLNAGVMENGAIEYPEAGSPQGGVISPLLANVYLHEVFDDWFVSTAKPRLQSAAFACRYADDLVVVCSSREDAQRLLAVLPKRFGKFGLKLHPTKTRMVDFRRPTGRPRLRRGQRPGTFDLLGFTHAWVNPKGRRCIIRRSTAKNRLRRAIKRVWEWCRTNRHMLIDDQHRALSAKLRGHYGYYGVTGNFYALAKFVLAVGRAWRRWLSRRSQRGRVWWPKFNRMLRRYPLPSPRITHPARSRAASL